ncbi:Uncharacterized protein OBRU01_11925, partial [Operophtera brumata]
MVMIDSSWLFIAVAPKWNEEPHNTSLLLGRNGHIACSANGYPQPQTHWLKKDEPVTFDIASRNMTAKLGQQITIEVKISEMKSEDGMTNILELLQTETSDGALYQCRAGNPFGADVYSVHLTILEPPSPPSDLSIDSLKSRSVKLSWRDMTRSLAQYYSLQITTSQRLSWSSARTVNVTRLDEIRHAVEIEDLQPATSYTARVAGGNQADLSHFSTPVRFSTTEEGELRVRWLPPPADTHHGLIIGYRLRAVPQLNGIKALRVSWQPIPPHKQAGALIGYTVLYAAQGLLKFTNYTVKVAGFSNYGLGPFSYPIVCSTLQDAPAEIKLLSQSSNTLLVSWKMPRQPNGRLLHYTVYCKPTSSSNSDLFSVVAGVASLGGAITVAVRNSLLLECRSVGSPPPRTVWYHNQNIITHHPRFTRNRDDSLFIISTAFTRRACASRNAVQRLHSAWPVTKETRLLGTQQHTLAGLKCGTKYSVRVTATDNIGTSAPAHVNVITLGSGDNATHIYIQLSGWDDGGCDVTKWDVEYRPLGSSAWMKAENKAPMDIHLGWSYIEGHYQAPPLRSIPTSYAVGGLAPSSWYQLRVTATNDAGTANTIYTLLVACLMAFVCILLKRHRHSFSSQYRHSIAEEAKSRHEKMFEISPYAEFALGFRTFEHVENQDLPMPSRLPSRPRFDTGECSPQLVPSRPRFDT